jgi:hypothetical protein
MFPQTTDPTLNLARQAAYRRLALTILGVDVQTLTADLRARRLEAAAAAPTELQLDPLSLKAA